MNMPLLPIRVGPSGRYFQTFNGQPFLFIGANDAIAWVGIEPLLGKRDVPAVETYLRSFADNGVTVLRIMLEYVHHDRFYFENPVGTFVPEMVALWDDLFDICERLGLRVLLTPWDTFWMSLRWDHHPYNACNGGPASVNTAFFTDETTIQAVIRRFEFVIERWRGRAVIAAWDLWNEIHPHYGTASEQFAVIERISRAVREAEERVQGWTRPQTVSIYGPQPAPEYHDLIFNHPSLDFSSTHIYWKGAIDFPRNTVTAASVMAKWTRYGLEHTPPTRPFLDSEHAPIHLFNDHRRMLPLKFDVEYERHLMWAHLCSGGAGSGLRWPARHPHILAEGIRKAFRGLAEFCTLIDWNHFVPTDWRRKIRVSGTESRSLHLFAVGDGHQVIGLLLRRQPSGHRGQTPPLGLLSSTQVELKGLHAGCYQVTVFDPIRGIQIHQQQMQAVRGQIAVSLPPWEHEIAFAVREVKINEHDSAFPLP